MTIHAAACSSGFFLCKEAEDARGLCLTGNDHRYRGGKSLYGWLFQDDYSLKLLSELDVIFYVGLKDEKVLELNHEEYCKAWYEVKQTANT